MSEIRIDPHTLVRAQERGVSTPEIESVIRDGDPFEAAPGRNAKFKVFDFYSTWNGRFYDQKKVVVILPDGRKCYRDSNGVRVLWPLDC